MTNYLLMTTKELNIKSVMDKHLNGEITELESSQLIQKSLRQTQRIKKRYKLEWDKWLIHKLRWKKSNHKYDSSKYEKALEIVQEKYNDYSITLCSERLEELHNIKISVPTLRNEMIRNWIRKVKRRKRPWKQFYARERKKNYGEMIQYDWSYHKWFECRNGTEYQCLLVSVDDSTWELYCKFDKNEWICATFNYWKEYIKIKWKPKSIYLDKFATYKINYPDATDDKEMKTQFWRVCETLNINVIFANSPQAKWRVERMNLTLQDRLVKALREEDISDIETANIFLKEKFIPDFNKKFMVESRWNSNLHILLRIDEESKLDQIFSEHKERKIMNDFTIRFENNFYQLYRNKDWWSIFYKWDKVTVEKHLNWDIKISKNWKYIESKLLPKRPQRLYKLPLAPINEEDIDIMRKNIELENTKKQEEKVNNSNKKDKTDTYYERTWTSHPWMKNFNFWKKSKQKIKTKNQN